MKKSNNTIDLLIGPIGEVNTALGQKARTGKQMSSIKKIKNAAIAIDNNKIVACGPYKDIKKQFKAKKNLDWQDKLVLPGFVDSHTHALFARSRAWEYGLRLKGASYLDIAKKGGGILKSCEDLHKLSKRQLSGNLKQVLKRMRAQGTTTVEVKSGYGLTLASELKMLEVIKSVSRRHPMRLIPTFLGAHEFPKKYRKRKNEFVSLITDKWLEEVSQKNLAEFCDVFCDVGVFTKTQTKKILVKAQELGFKLKVHSDEFESFGATELAASLGAFSADHLGAITAKGIKALSKTNGQTIATLLPGTCFTLDLKKWPPARKMIENNIAIALATDCNPGSCMTESLPFVMSLACNKLKMTAEESLTAVTLNAAAALGRSQTLGSLEKGKFADISFWNCSKIEEIPYHINGNLCQGTLVNGDLYW